MLDIAKPAVTEVPFLDLSLIHEPLKERILEDIGRLIDSNAYSNGPQVAEFEAAFARFCGTSDCVGVASGLDALRLALIAMNLEPGDEVIVPANTFIATFEAVTQAGGRPVPVDVTTADYNMDVQALESALSARTRCVLPVHLYGQMADLRGIRAVLADRSIHVLEDACQAHGATRTGLRAGVNGDAAAFSFYPGKNLGAFGDAGALTTNDDALAKRVRALREHGQSAKYRHDIVGWTARLDSIQAVVLLHKLGQLEQWNDQRRAAAALYGEYLADAGDLRLPRVATDSQPVWHLYAVRTQRRDELADHLRANGIGVGLHYPQPAHLSGAYQDLGYRSGSFPVSEALADELASLPIFPGITEEQIARVASVVRAFFDGV
jgi:dTDP-4-amino-4,6-dideoxygalactose transaminase